MAMSSTTLVPGALLFAASVTVLARCANAAQFPPLVARQGGGGNGDSGALPAPPSTPSSMLNSFSSSLTSSAHSSSSYTSLSSSSTPSATNNPSADAVGRRASTGIIVGVVIGSVVLVGLMLMIFAKYRGRARKNRKRPQGFGFSTFLTPTLESTEDMPKTRMELLTFSATPVVPDPDQPIMPLNPTKRLSQRLTSMASTPNFSLHEPLQSLYQSSALMDSVLAGVAAPATSASSVTSTSTSTPQSLHREMTIFQKGLEAERKEIEASNGADHHPDTTDPPPEYGS